MFTMQTGPRKWVIAALALGLSALACSAPAASGQTTPTEAATAALVATTEAPTSAPAATTPASGPDVIPQGPTATAGASPTPQPTAAPAGPTDTPPTGGGQAQYQNISFYFLYSVSSKWEVKTVPSDPTGNGVDAWRVATHYEFTFPDYPVSDQYQAARIMVFPTSAWANNYNPEVEKRIPELQHLLQYKQTTFGDNEEIPVVPVFNAKQVFRAHVAYLDFKSGSGIRFITQYDQAPIPINNGELFYTFQGVTADAKYNIAAFFPISHPSLPADSSNAPQVIGSDFLAYLATTTQALEAQKDSSFTPDLAALDQMMQSLEIK